MYIATNIHSLVVVCGFLVGSQPVPPWKNNPPVYSNTEPAAPGYDPDCNMSLQPATSDGRNNSLP